MDPKAGQRQPDVAERAQLLRFTGWGSLPAAFNLEAVRSETISQ